MNKLTVSQRLALGFGILLMCTVLTTLLGIWQLHTASRATQGIIEKPLAKERLISDWYLLIHSAVRRTTAIAKSTDPALATFFAEEQKASAATVTALQQQVDALMESNAERALFSAISDVRKTYSEARDEVIRLKRDGHPDEADRLLEQRFIPAARTYQNKVQELVQMQRAALDGAAGPIRLANEEAQYLLAALGLFGTLIGVAAAALIARSIVRPLQTALQAAQHVAQGDLTSHAELAAHGADEPAQLLAALAEMRMALTRVIQSIHRSTEEIVSASTQVAAGSGDLAERTSTTSAHLQDTSEAMSRLNATVEQAADSARTATTVAEEAARVATDGGAVVSRAVAAMDEVNASSQRIADITGTIDSIAFQTNILALNAAVEAARAGEQGRGFAVVASEVRSLAQRSAAAAREIKDLIQGSVEQVQTGTTLVQSAGATMEDIVSAVHRVSQVVSDIAGTARLQSERIESVNHAIGQLEQIAQQNTVLVEELSTSSSRLRTQAGDLSQSVSTFRH